MSNTTVKKIKESELVELIANIVAEAVSIKKAEWIAESAKNEVDKTALLETRLAALEKMIAKK